MGNETAGAATPAYTMGYGPEFLKLLERRNAATGSAHLLPHLRPGLRVLDLGCGPGSISVGLADAVAPGELLGVDMEGSQIEIARAAASAGGHDNATFMTGDATDLPCEDASFDVVHCHALLNHVPDTQAALAEMRRVLRPGGMVAARELIGDSAFFEPAHDFDDGEESAWGTFLALLAANGGHPQMGKELKRALFDAGFADIHATGSFESFSSGEDLKFLEGLVNGWFFAPETVAAATKLGLASPERFETWRASLDEWMSDPGAFAALAWGEAIARRP